jgi:hypothetical protein
MSQPSNCSANNSLSPELLTFLDELDSIPWFENAGKPLKDTNVKQVSSFQEGWEYLTENSENWSEFHLHVDSKLHAWQMAYDRAKAAVLKRKALLGIDNEIMIEDSAAYDAAGAASEIAKNSQENLFRNLMDWYRRGHWPCGWDGKYPHGKLIVF